MLSHHNYPEEKYTIALPCEPDQFSDFVSKLLGKPQTITKSFVGSFDITEEDIKNAYHLVTQRVKQQNKSSLIQFTVKLIFNDDSSVLLNSFDEFLSYAEVRPLVTTQVHLSWSFLVQFEDKSSPEKQEIDLGFSTRAGNMISVFESEDSMQIPLAKLLGGGGIISFRVKHTARTWGADIEALISGHIKNTMKSEVGIKRFVQDHSAKIGILFGVLFFILSVAACFYSASQVRITQLASIKDFLVNNVSNSEKIDYLIQLNATGFWGSYFFSVFIFITASFILSIFLSIWVAESSSGSRPSHILLTSKSKDNKLVLDKKYEKKWLSFIVSVFVSVIAGIVANIIFTNFWS